MGAQSIAELEVNISANMASLYTGLREGLDKVLQAVRQFTDQFDAVVKTLNRAQNASLQSADSLVRLAAAQQEAARRSQLVKDAFQSQLEQMQITRVAAANLATTLNQLGSGNRDIARSIFGTRSSRDILNEIQLVKDALASLPRQSATDLQEFARNFEVARPRIQALVTELEGLPKAFSKLRVAREEILALTDALKTFGSVGGAGAFPVNRDIARSILGIRSTQDILNEMNLIKKARDEILFGGRGFEEEARATEAARVKLEALEKEYNGAAIASDVMTQKINAANTALLQQTAQLEQSRVKALAYRNAVAAAGTSNLDTSRVTLGIRDTATIVNDIKAAQTAFENFKASTTDSLEIARAFQAMSAKVQQFKAELSGLPASVSALKTARAEVQNLQAVLANLGTGDKDIAHSILGSRSDEDITARIKLIESALASLANKAGVSSAELSRGQEAARIKTEALRIELLGTLTAAEQFAQRVRIANDALAAQVGQIDQNRARLQAYRDALAKAGTSDLRPSQAVLNVADSATIIQELTLVKEAFNNIKTSGTATGQDVTRAFVTLGSVVAQLKAQLAGLPAAASGLAIARAETQTLITLLRQGTGGADLSHAIFGTRPVSDMLADIKKLELALRGLVASGAPKVDITLNTEALRTKLAQVVAEFRGVTPAVDQMAQHINAANDALKNQVTQLEAARVKAQVYGQAISGAGTGNLDLARSVLGYRSNSDIQQQLANVAGSLSIAQRAFRAGAIDVRELTRAEASAAVMTKELDRELAGLGPTSQQVSISFSTIARALGFFSGIGLVAVLVRDVISLGKEFVTTGDSATLLRGRLNLLFGDAEKAKEVFSTIAADASKLRAPISDVVANFSRLGIAVKDIGGGVQEARKLNDIILATGRISGQTAEEATAAARQFVQAVGSGRFQGDELRSLLENNLRFGQLLAQSLGVSVQKVRELGQEGALTSDVVLPILIRNHERIVGELTSLPKTFADAYQILKNEISLTAISINDASGTTKKWADNLLIVAEVLAAIRDGRYGDLFKPPQTTSGAQADARQQRNQDFTYQPQAFEFLPEPPVTAPAQKTFNAADFPDETLRGRVADANAQFFGLTASITGAKDAYEKLSSHLADPLRKITDEMSKVNAAGEKLIELREKDLFQLRLDSASEEAILAAETAVAEARVDLQYRQSVGIKRYNEAVDAENRKREAEERRLLGDVSGRLSEIKKGYDVQHAAVEEANRVEQSLLKQRQDYIEFYAHAGYLTETEAIRLRTEARIEAARNDLIAARENQANLQDELVKVQSLVIHESDSSGQQNKDNQILDINKRLIEAKGKVRIAEEAITIATREGWQTELLRLRAVETTLIATQRAADDYARSLQRQIDARQLEIALISQSSVEQQQAAIAYDAIVKVQEKELAIAREIEDLEAGRKAVPDRAIAIAAARVEMGLFRDATLDAAAKMQLLVQAEHDVREAAKGIEDAFHGVKDFFDQLIDAFAQGKSLIDVLKSSLKSLALSITKELFAKQIVLPIFAGITGASQEKLGEGISPVLSSIDSVFKGILGKLFGINIPGVSNNPQLAALSKAALATSQDLVALSTPAKEFNSLLVQARASLEDFTRAIQQTVDALRAEDLRHGPVGPKLSSVGVDASDFTSGLGGSQTLVFTEFEDKLILATRGAEAFEGSIAPLKTSVAASTVAVDAFAAKMIQTDIGQIIIDAAKRYNINPAAGLAIAEQESGFRNNVLPRSDTGAAGVFQFIPSTARGYGIDPFDQRQAADAWGKMFRENLDRFNGDYRTAIGSHFAGPDLAQHGPKTAKYEDEVIARMQKYDVALANTAASTTKLGTTVDSTSTKLATVEAPKLDVAPVQEAFDKLAEIKPELSTQDFDRTLSALNTDVAQVRGPLVEAFSGIKDAAIEAAKFVSEPQTALGNALQDQIKTFFSEPPPTIDFSAAEDSVSRFQSRIERANSAAEETGTDLAGLAAKAVQAGEAQSTLATATDDFKKGISEAANVKIEVPKPDFGPFEDSVSRVSDRLDRIKIEANVAVEATADVNVGTLQQKLDTLASDVNVEELDRSFAAVEESSSKLAASAQKVSTDLAGIDVTEVGAQFRSVSQVSGTTVVSIAGLGTASDVTAGAVVGFGNKLDSINPETGLRALSTQSEETASDLAGVTAAIVQASSGLTSTTPAITESLRSLDSSFVLVSTRSDALADGFGVTTPAITESLRNLDSSFAQTAARSNDVAGGLGSLLGTFGAFAGGIGAIFRSLGSLGAGGGGAGGVSGAVSGIGGVAGRTASLFGTSSVFGQLPFVSGAGPLAAGTGIAGSLAGAGFPTAASFAAGFGSPIATISTAVTEGLAAAGGIAGVVGAAIPVIGVALAAGTLIYGLLHDDKPSPTRGQFQISSGKTGFEDNQFTASSFGNLGFADSATQYFSGEAAQAFNKIVGGALDAFKTRFSPAQTEKLAGILQNTTFPGSTGKTQSTEDFIKEYGGTILKQVVKAAFDVLDPALGAVAEKFEGTADEFSNFANTLLGVHDAVKTFGDNFSATLGTVFVTSFKAAQGAITSAQGALNSAVATAADAAIQVKPDPKPLQAAIDGVIQSVKPDTKPLETSVVGAIDAAIEAVKPDTTPLTTSVQDAVDGAVAAVKVPKLPATVAESLPKPGLRPGGVSSVGGPDIDTGAAEQAAKDFVQHFVDSINEALADATQETADKVLAFVNAVNIAGQALPALAIQLASLDPASILAFVDALGGAAKVAEQFSFLGSNFTTSADRLSVVTSQLNAGFAALGVTIPQTHEAFLAILSSFDLTTESGRAAYESVLNLSQAFVQVHGTAEQAAANVDKFRASFTTSTKTTADALDSLSTTFGALGFAVPQTHAEFLAIYDSLNNINDPAHEARDALLEASDAFVTLHGTADQAAQRLLDAAHLFGSSEAFFSPDEQAANQAAEALAAIGEASVRLRVELPTTAAGFRQFIESLNQADPVQHQLYNDTIILTQAYVDLAGAQSRAAESAAALGRALNQYYVDQASSAFANVISAIDSLVSASGGDFGSRLALRIRLIQEQFNNIQKAYYDALNTGNYQLANEFRLELAKFPDLGPIIADLARFNVLSAQYGPGIAEKLVQLEDAHKATVAILANNAEALAAENANFQKAWSDIINGTEGAANTLDAILQKIDKELQGFGFTFGETITLRIALLSHELSEAFKTLGEGSITAGLRKTLATTKAELLLYNQILQQTGNEGIAQRIIELQKWYNDLVPTLAGDAEALAVVQSVFDSEWNKIINGIEDGTNNLIDSIKKIKDYLEQLKLSDLSPLTPFQKFQEAQGAFNTQLGFAQSGDANALANITQYAQDYLTLARDAYASSPSYTAIYNAVTTALAGLANLTTTTVPTGTGSTTPGVTTVPTGTGTGTATGTVAGATAGNYTTVLNKIAAALDLLVAAAPDWTLQFGRLHTDLVAIKDVVASSGPVPPSIDSFERTLAPNAPAQINALTTAPAPVDLGVVISAINIGVAAIVAAINALAAARLPIVAPATTNVATTSVTNVTNVENIANQISNVATTLNQVATTLTQISNTLQSSVANVSNTNNVSNATTTLTSITNAIDDSTQVQTAATTNLSNSVINETNALEQVTNVFNQQAAAQVIAQPAPAVLPTPIDYTALLNALIDAVKAIGIAPAIGSTPNAPAQINELTAVPAPIDLGVVVGAINIGVTAIVSAINALAARPVSSPTVAPTVENTLASSVSTTTNISSSELVTNVANIANQISNVATTLNQVATTLTQISSSLQSSIANITNTSSVSNATTQLTSITNAIDNSSIVETVSTQIRNVANTLTQIANTLSSTLISNAVDNSTAVQNTAVTSLVAAAAPTATPVPPATVDYTSALQAIVDAIKALVIAPAITSTTSSAETNIANSAVTQIENVTNALTQINQVMQQVTSVLTNVDASISSVAVNTATSTTTVVNELTNIANTLTQIANTLTQVTTAVSNQIQNVVNSETTVATPAESAPDYTLLLTAIVDAIKAITVTPIAGSSTSTTTDTTVVNNAITQIDNVTNALTTISNAITSSLTQIANTLTANTTSTSNQVQNVANTATTNVFDQSVTLAVTQIENVANVLTQIANTLNEITTQVSNQTQNIANSEINNALTQPTTLNQYQVGEPVAPEILDYLDSIASESAAITASLAAIVDAVAEPPALSLPVPTTALTPAPAAVLNAPISVEAELVASPASLSPADLAAQTARLEDKFDSLEQTIAQMLLGLGKSARENTEREIDGGHRDAQVIVDGLGGSLK